jgi:hypothetical protein
MGNEPYQLKALGSSGSLIGAVHLPQPLVLGLELPDCLGCFWLHCRPSI